MIARSTTFRFGALVFLLQILGATVLLLGLGAVLRSQSRADAIDLADTMRGDLLVSYAAGGAPALAQAIRARTTGGSDRSAVLFLAGPTGRALAGNLSRMPNGLAPGRSYQLARVLRAGHARPEATFVRATRLPHGELFVTGIVVEQERQVLAQVERATLLALLLAMLFAGFAAFVSTRLIVNRLQATVATLGRVREGDLARRVPRDGTGDAFARLGEEVNRTLDRVAALNAELKIATDAMAHDLKMPLTRIQYALDRLARSVEGAEASSALDQAFAESERLLATIETALSITRAEAGLGRESFRPTEVRAMLATIVDIYAPMVEDEGRAIVLEAPAPLTLPLHRQLMDQAIGNLIDNTLKYGAGTITLSVLANGTDVEIAVADEGPGIPEHRHAEAIARFHRLDQARSGWGAGLGLSLVQAVAHLHGGSLTLRDRSPGLEVAILVRPGAA